ncbi:hypothetical protein Glove_357g43 [Diversispora epigaea]|uniref:Uncharacterized protein n=1 Tax=Diversispora epigaea TaxID=1348612 RepID=A0A397HF19_9GLOM|nr:hypothetical protein Glove_357g43 [Diversispora epigaea]
MTNDQLTINTLRELNSRLASEITELRKENAEISELRKKFSEVEAENNELKAENNDKDTAVENAELKARVAKLEQKQSQTDEKNNFIVKSDDDAKGIDQSSVNITSTETENSNDTPASNISDNTSNVAPERIENRKRIADLSLLSFIYHRKRKKSEFLELQEKERISNMVRERNRKKKICRGQQIVQKTSSSFDTQNAISTEINPIIEITHERKTTKLESMPTDQAQNTGIKIPYNKRVEQDLRHDLSVFIKENNNKVSEVFYIQIPEFSLEIIITGSSKITAQNIADLFMIVMKVRQKEILCWYCYYKVYEDRIKDVKHTNRIDNQSAWTLVYNEIKSLLSDITNMIIIGVTNCNVHVTEQTLPETKVNSNSEFSDGGENDDEDKFLGEKDKSLLKTKISIPFNLAYNHANFHNKITEQYSDLYWEGSDGNDDYYEITDESLCPLYKLDHYEEYIKLSTVQFGPVWQ